MADRRQDDRRELMRLEELRIDAVIQRNLPILDKVFADDVISINGDGVVRGKSELLNNLQTRGRILALERQSTEIRFHGRTALMFGSIRMRMQAAQTAVPVTQDYQVLQLWIKGAEGWKQASYQATAASSPLQ